MNPLRSIRCLVVLFLLVNGSAWLAAKQATWVEVTSPHFVAYSDAGEAAARKALEGFEGIRSVFSTVLPGLRVDPPRPTFVIVAKDEASMKRFLPKPFEGRDPKRPAGMFISGPERNYAILRLDVDHQADQSYFILFHEYTHSIVHHNFPSLPTWLDEGIADFYGATEIRSKRVYIGRVPTGRLARLRAGVGLPLETLFRVTHDSPHYQEGEKTGIFYAQSWALVHYLFMNEQARQAGLFQAYLQALGRGADSLAAAREGFGDLDKLQGRLAQYSRQSAFTFWNLPLAVELTDKTFHARTLDGVEALVVRAEFLQHSQQEPAALSLLEEALAGAPQRPEVQTALGCGFLLQGDKDKARAAFEAALRLGSRDFRTPYQLARLAQEGPGAGGPAAGQILAWLESAQALRPDFPGIHMALCRQYARDPRDPERSIREGTAAVDLEPQVLAHRANLGMACMSLDRDQEAIAIGEQLRALAVTEEDRRMATSYAEVLARFLEQRRIRAAEAASGARHPSVERGGPSRSVPVKFSLPSYFAPLGQEVIRLVSEGRTEEAIRKVEKALAAANNAYDRKALRTLLATLRGGASPK